MKDLTVEYWRKFKSDGKMFEQLSKRLIELEYNSKNFFIVGGKGDGGKDIEKEIKLLDDYKTSIWAQCKFHKKSLSFDDISYTLLMAYLENTNQILIFSYSKVTDDFKDKMEHYIRRTEKNVIIYADEELERLILKHRESLDSLETKFFDNWPNPVKKTNIKDLECKYNLFINNKQITNKEVTVNLNTICELNFIISNHSDKKIKMSINVLKNSIYKNFIFLENNNEKSEIEILPNYILSISTYIRLNKNINKTNLPTFIVEFDGKIIKLMLDKELKYRWLAETQLLGAKYLNFQKVLHDIINTDSFKIAYIYGESGTGKSRLIKEAETISYICGAKNISIDTEKKEMSCRMFLNVLCSELTDLPFFDNMIKSYNYEGNEKTLAYAARIMYDENFDISKEWEKIANFIVYMLSKSKYILSLDNIQHFDEITLKILETVIYLLKHSSSSSTIILVINTDFIYPNSNFDNFFRKIKSDADRERNIYYDCFVNGFTHDESELYIRECLSFSYKEYKHEESQYDRTITDISNRCENNPFYIQQFLLYLEQIDVIRRSDNTIFYFYDIENYNNCLNEIPKSIKQLVEERESLFLQKCDESLKEKYKNLIYLLNLTKVLPVSMYYKTIKDRDLLLHLQDLGFITITADDAIVPYHNYFTIYFNKQYNLESISENLDNQFITSVEDLNLQDDFAFSLFWAKTHLNRENHDDLKRVIMKLKSWNTDYRQYNFCFKPISLCLENNRCLFDTHTYILVYEKICQILEKITGIDSANYYYEKVLNNYINNPYDFKDSIEEVCEFIRSYLISLINLEDYEHCIKIIDSLNSTEDVCEKSGKILELFSNQCKIMIYNRTNQLNDAISLSKTNINILEEPNFNESLREKYIYSAKRSIGNSYFFSTEAYKNREKIVASWDDSFVSYTNTFGIDANSEFSNQSKIAAYSKGLAADIIAERECNAIIKANYLSNALDKMHMPYYEMQIRLLLGIYYIWKRSDTNQYPQKFNQIISIINQSIDISNIYGRKLTTINGFYLKGIAYLKNNDSIHALDNYCITADYLYKYLNDCDDYYRWSFFWIDFAILCRVSEKNMINLSRIKDYNLRNKLKMILEMDENTFNKYCNNYIPLTAITDKSHSLSFPKI